MCIVILCQPGCDVINFAINLIFLTESFFLHDQKVKTKILKRAFKTSKGFYCVNKTIFLDGESPTLNISARC